MQHHLLFDPPKDDDSGWEFIALKLHGMNKAGKMGDDELHEHLQKLPGVEVTQYIPEYVTEAIINFTFKGYTFRVDNSYRMWQFWVNDKSCQEEIFTELVVHCLKVLSPYPVNIVGRKSDG